MLHGRGPGGPKPTKWTGADGQSLKSFFARQAEAQRHPDNAAMDLEWTFSIDGDETQKARVRIGGGIKHLTFGLIGTLLRKGSGFEPGDGTCHAYWKLDGREMAEPCAGATRMVRGGTGDLEMQLDDGSRVWVTARHVAPSDTAGGTPQPGHVAPPPPPPPPEAPGVEQEQRDQRSALLATERSKREEKHTRMRAHIAWLITHQFGGKQVGLCDAVGLTSAWFSLYKKGKNGHGKDLTLSELDDRHGCLRRALKHRKLPLPLEHTAAAAPANLPARGRGRAAEGGGAANKTVPQQPAARAAAPPKLPVLSVNLRDVQGAKAGGLVHIIDLGAAVSDARWKMDRPGGGTSPIFLRDGLRGRRAFRARRGSTMGGRNFEWWIEPLDSRHDQSHHGGPVWIARELTGTLASLGQRIVGRYAHPESGVHAGPSSPALLVKAIVRHCGLTLCTNGLVFTGLLHKSVQELLDVAAERAGLMKPEAPAAPASTFGARSGGLGGLKQGGSRLREVGEAAGIAFLEAMESVAPGDPEGAFAQLMLKPSFRIRFLAPEWRDGLSKTAVQEQILKTPFIATFVKVGAFTLATALDKRLSLISLIYPTALTTTTTFATTLTTAIATDTALATDTDTDTNTNTNTDTTLATGLSTAIDTATATTDALTS